MAYTPAEIRHLQLPRSLFGYRRAAVDRLLGEVADSFADVWRERAELADRVEHLDAEVRRYRELEKLLHTTLVSAERAGEELKEQARRETELIISEGHAEARSITRRALAERERLLTDARQVRALLRAALATVEELEEEAERQPADAAA